MLASKKGNKNNKKVLHITKIIYIGTNVPFVGIWIATSYALGGRRKRNPRQSPEYPFHRTYADPKNVRQRLAYHLVSACREPLRTLVLTVNVSIPSYSGSRASVCDNGARGGGENGHSWSISSLDTLGFNFNVL